MSSLLHLAKTCIRGNRQEYFAHGLFSEVYWHLVFTGGSYIWHTLISALHNVQRWSVFNENLYLLTAVTAVGDHDHFDGLQNIYSNALTEACSTRKSQINGL